MAAERMGLAVLALLLGVGVGAGCSSGASADASGAGPANGPSLSLAGAGNGIGEPAVPGGDSSAGEPLPPEKELDQSFRAPVATGRVLWSANPDSGRVALIDAKTLKVRMANAGFGPTFLAAVPSKKGVDSAIVLNVGSHDATWFSASTNDIASVTIPTHVGANAWAISASGRFAIAWTDVTQIASSANDSANGYSELTVLDLSLSPPTSTRLSVGFRPSKVVFDAATEHAYVVVDEGISVLELAKKSRLSQLLDLATDDRAAHARDVSFAPDGSFAVVRVDGSANVEIIDLKSNERRVVTLESTVTDLDLSPNGTRATAVLGDATPPRVLSFAVPVPQTDANASGANIPGELVRSVTLAPNGELALLYANAVPSAHLTLLDTADDSHRFEYRTLDLQGPVNGVFVAPDSSAAIAFQTPPSGSKKKGLFSIVPTEAMRPPRIVGTDAAPAEIAFSDSDTGTALVTVHDATSTVRGVYVIGLANLEQNFVSLSSEPLPGATGIVAEAKRGFVAQKHPEGRITFIDLDTGVAQTLSGFEIAARVVQ